MKISLLLLTILTSTMSCRSAATDGGGTESLYLKSYKVPEGMSAESVAHIMNNQFVLESGKGETKRIARVSTLPDGTLVVLGSENIQRGFESMIHGLGEVPIPNEENVRIECWVVLGMEDKKTDDPFLATLQPALDKIRPHKDFGFVKLEKVSILTITGQRSDVAGTYLRMEPRIAKVRDRYSLEVSLGMVQHNLKTRLNLNSGQLMVIGEREVNLENLLDEDHPIMKNGGKDYHIATLFYILKVTSN